MVAGVGSVGTTAIDGATRTDTWLSNQHEVRADADPWDPDTDDGLTDGQGERFVMGESTVDGCLVSQNALACTAALVVERERTTGTDPAKADTDGDGYWDGWIGVYGVGRTENVVLYRHHLNTGPVVDRTDAGRPIRAVSGDTAVPEQTDIHKVSDDSPGAYLFGNGTKYHSKIHIGELQWGTNPGTKESKPSPSLSIEVDYYAETNYGNLDSSSWTDSIETNFALYGINVTLVRDETISRSDHYPNMSFREGIEVAAFGGEQLEAVYERFGRNQTPGTDEYLFVGPEAQQGEPLGSNSYNPTMILNVPEIRDIVQNSTVPTSNVTFETEFSTVAGAVTIHEIGHSLCVGIADDIVRDPTHCQSREVYSGDSGLQINGTIYYPGDQTYEIIYGSPRRSVMRRGFDSDLYEPPLYGRYLVFSIEELSTIRDPSSFSRSGGPN